VSAATEQQRQQQRQREQVEISEIKSESWFATGDLATTHARVLLSAAPRAGDTLGKTERLGSKEQASESAASERTSGTDARNKSILRDVRAL